MTAGPAPRSGSGACSARPTGERTAPPTSAGPPPAGNGAAPDGSGTDPDAPAAELRPAAEDRWAGELAALAAADTASGAEVPQAGGCPRARCAPSSSGTRPWG